MLLVDAQTHLHGHRHLPRPPDGANSGLTGAHRLGEDRRQQVSLPRQRRPTALAGHLGDRAAEVQVDVVGQILLHQDPHRGPHRGRIDPVELDGTHPLGRIGAHHRQSALVALHQGAGGDHLRDVQARRGQQAAVRRGQRTGMGGPQRLRQGCLSHLPAQAAEGGVGDSGHGGELDRGGHHQWPDAQWRGRAARGAGVGEAGGGLTHRHPDMLTHGGGQGRDRPRPATPNRHRYRPLVKEVIGMDQYQRMTKLLMASADARYLVCLC